MLGRFQRWAKLLTGLPALSHLKDSVIPPHDCFRGIIRSLYVVALQTMVSHARAIFRLRAFSSGMKAERDGRRHSLRCLLAVSRHGEPHTPCESSHSVVPVHPTLRRKASGYQ